MARQARPLEVVRSTRPDAGKRTVRRAPPEPVPLRPRRTPTRGILVGLTVEGRLLARWTGNEEPGVVSFAVHLARRVLLEAVARQAAVLIDFVDGDPDQPVLVGLLRDRLDDVDDGLGTLELEDVTLRAPSSLSLECGQSSITLTHSGRVTIRGTEVVSESTGAVKLKGAYVELN
jgi:hypothetical protein